MLPKPESAYFLIADISGYTSFLAGVQLDHAQDIIADLMDTVVKGLRPPFRLAKFEGDAAFVYAATAKIDGEMVKQKMGGREELAGRDVIVVHRLLKNTVSEKVGDRAYALYSDACVQMV